jgi:hypothetical protein
MSDRANLYDAAAECNYFYHSNVFFPTTMHARVLITMIHCKKVKKKIVFARTRTGDLQCVRLT